MKSFFAVKKKRSENVPTLMIITIEWEKKNPLHFAFPSSLAILIMVRPKSQDVRAWKRERESVFRNNLKLPKSTKRMIENAEQK